MNVLAHVTRSGLSESRHHGFVALADSQGVVHYSSGPLTEDVPAFMRSSSKPLQALALVESGAADHFELSEAEIALACASHSSEQLHTSTVQKMLEKGGLTKEQLLCGSHPPMYIPEAERMILNGELPTTLHSNCSGKHTGMLLTCVHMGWPTENYTEPNHPLQQYILGIVADFVGVAPQQIITGVDGCTAVNFAVTVGQMAVMFARLDDAEYWQNQGKTERAAAVQRITKAMMAHPFMVSGSDRNDKDMMEAAPGQIFCKGGAEGVWCLGFPGKKLGLALKIEDGFARPQNVVVAEVLHRTHLLDDAAIARFAEKQIKPIKNMRGIIVGNIEPAFEFKAPTEWE